MSKASLQQQQPPMADFQDASVDAVPRVLARPARKRATRPILEQWLSRWSLPVAFVVALSAGLLYLLVVPPWQGPDEPSHFAYVALLYHHNLDDRVVQSIDFGASEREGDPALVQAISASMERNGFAGYVPGYGAPGSELGPNYRMFQEARQPAAYYWFAAAALRLARVLGVDADPYTNADTALLVARGATLLLSLGTIVLAWLAGALLSSRPWLRLLLPLTLALFPQHLFLVSLVNNDVLAELTVSALFVALLALLMRPYERQSVAFAIVSLFFGLLSVQVKSTAVAAAIPLLLLGFIVWLGLLISRWAKQRRIFPTLPVLPALTLLLAAFCIAGAWLAIGEHDGEAASWTTGQTDNPPVERVYAPDAHDGTHIIQVSGTGEERAAVQMLIPLTHHPAYQFNMGGWVRLPTGGPSGAPPKQATGSIALYSGKEKVSSGEVSLSSPGVWTHIQFSGAVPSNGDPVTIKLLAGGDATTVQFDDLSLQVIPTGAYWTVPFYVPTLLNPSGEGAAAGVQPPLNHLVPQELRQMIGVLLTPQQYSIAEVSGLFVREQYRSFWGDFGWLALPLPDALYFAFCALLLLALAGLLVRGLRRLGNWQTVEWLGLASLLALVAAVLIGVARQLMLLSLYGIPAFPQGRYLFVLLIPFTWLFIVGLLEIWALLTGAASEMATLAASRQGSAPNAATGVSHKWVALVWVVALLLFQGYCYFGLIMPYFHK